MLSRSLLLIAGAVSVAVMVSCSGDAIDVRGVFGIGDLAREEIGGSQRALGKKHFSQGRYGLAVKHFQSAVAREPGSIDVLNGLAASYDRIGRFDLAERYYRQALGLDKQSPLTLNNLGYSYYLRGKLDLAVGYMREAVAASDNDLVILNNQRIIETAYASTNRQIARLEEEKPTPVRVVKRTAEKPATEPHRVRIERTNALVQTLVTKKPKRSSFTAASVLNENGAAAHKATTGQVGLAALDRRKGPGEREVRSSKYGGGPVIGVAMTLPQVPRAKPPVPQIDNTKPLIEISNGTGRLGMAARMSRYLSSSGVITDRLSNADNYSKSLTTIFYRDGWRDHAAVLAKLLPRKAKIRRADEQSAKVRIVLGADLLKFDRRLFYARRKENHDASI